VTIGILSGVLMVPERPHLEIDSAVNKVFRWFLSGETLLWVPA